MATDGQKKRCFVAGPLGSPESQERSHADWLLQGIIQPVFAQHFPEFFVERADQITAPGMIDSQVINRLLEAELVIIDMTFQNANAFYEMGIRHMKRLPTIHMYLEGQTIPFDVKPYRALEFKYSHPNDLTIAKGKLKATVEEAIKPEFEVENPVTRARGIEKLDDHVMPAQTVILEQLAALQDRVAKAENLSSTVLSAVLGALPTEPLPGAGLRLASLRPGEYRHLVETVWPSKTATAPGGVLPGTGSGGSGGILGNLTPGSGDQR
jgi:hypothetical protein